jgi:hypothetical protein
MDKPPHSDCRPFGLAESQVGNVAICPACGVIHVTLQYVTMRLEPGAFLEFTRLLGHARVALAGMIQRPDGARADTDPASRPAAGPVH